MPKICLGNMRFEYRVGFISLEMAHQMVIAKRDMYDVLNFSNIITIYKTKYILYFHLYPQHQQVSLTDTGSGTATGTIPYAI